ncbi:unnamed protein product [Orchesella dallaii]|uniref:Uncharacterized protein n=1 Tax=Orchesella dallaii TaxID=48710 RepID=A0ABP1S5C3_9HEXA
MDTRREIDCNDLEKSQQFKDDLEEIVTQMEDIETTFKLLQKKLWKAVDIHSEAKTAIDSFSAFHNGDNWAALSRSDILEFRKLLKNDLRIVKFRELNVDELKREWDEADIYRKAKDSILKVMVIQLAMQATTRTSELNR